MNNQKERLLKNLQNTYCRLKPSEIEGIGVFAIKNIPKGVNPFQVIRQEKWLKLNMRDLSGIGKEVLKMIDDFFVIEQDGTVLILEHGLNNLNISFFVNNSDAPNLYTPDEGFTFITLRNIKKDEELTVSYATYDEKYKKR